MKQEIEEYITKCDKCQAANPDNRPAPAELHPIRVKYLFERWGIDLIGPLHLTERDNVYIITATEYLSKWAIAKPLPDKSAEGATFSYAFYV